MEIIHGKYENIVLLINLMDQTSKIFSRVCQNKASEKLYNNTDMIFSKNNVDGNYGKIRIKKT